MDDNFRELEREAFEATFDGKDAAGASESAGYGLDPRQADVNAMASAFDGAEPVVGGPMRIAKVESSPLPEASGEMPAADKSPEVAEPSTTPAAAEATPKFKTFGQAFKYHRAQAANGGPSTFEWNGKKFTTQLKSEVAPSKAKPAKNKAAAEAAKFESEFINRDKPPAMTLAQAKAKEYADAENAARASGSHADRLKANQALRTAEQAIEAQREGKSVVLKRPDATAKAIQQADQAFAPDFDPLQYANVGSRNFSGKK